MTTDHNQQRLTAWDGLSLCAPPGWEPVRLGRGYMLLADEGGPRLELRWQAVPKGFTPARALERLARKGQLARNPTPGACAAQALDALPHSAHATACAVAGQARREAVLLALPQGRLAVVAGLFATDDEDPALLARVLASVSDARPRLVRLYDIDAVAPEGCALSDFTFKLGQYRIQFGRGALQVVLHRLAPAGVVLGGAALEAWAGPVFAGEVGGRGQWMGGAFKGMDAARFKAKGPAGPPGVLRRLAARLWPGLAFAAGRVWRADASRILAVTARHAGQLSPETFEDVCRGYHVVSP